MEDVDPDAVVTGMDVEKRFLFRILIFFAQHVTKLVIWPL